MPHAPFTAEEYTDMVLIYGECQQNAALALRTYKERYGSSRRCPTHGRTFIKTVLRLRENLPIVPKTVESGSSKELPIAREEVILDHFDKNPETSLREAAKQFKVSHSTVSRILKRKNEDLP